MVHPLQRPPLVYQRNGVTFCDSRATCASAVPPQRGGAARLRDAMSGPRGNAQGMATSKGSLGQPTDMLLEDPEVLRYVM